MEIETHTCPFTGMSFDAVRTDDALITTNPLTDERLTFPITDGCIQVPLAALGKMEIMSPAQAAECLDVSRQRVDQLAAAGTIRQRYVNGAPVYLFREVVEYKNKRKNGRPRKE